MWHIYWKCLRNSLLPNIKYKCIYVERLTYCIEAFFTKNHASLIKFQCLKRICSCEIYNSCYVAILGVIMWTIRSIFIWWLAIVGCDNENGMMTQCSIVTTLANLVKPT